MYQLVQQTTFVKFTNLTYRSGLFNCFNWFICCRNTGQKGWSYCKICQSIDFVYCIASLKSVAVPLRYAFYFRTDIKARASKSLTTLYNFDMLLQTISQTVLTFQILYRLSLGHARNDVKVGLSCFTLKLSLDRFLKNKLRTISGNRISGCFKQIPLNSSTSDDDAQRTSLQRVRAFHPAAMWHCND